MKAAQDKTREIRYSTSEDNTWYYGIAVAFKSRTGVAHYGSAIVYKNGSVHLEADGKFGRTAPTICLEPGRVAKLTACPKCPALAGAEWEEIELVYIDPNEDKPAPEEEPARSIAAHAEELESLSELEWEIMDTLEAIEAEFNAALTDWDESKDDRRFVARVRCDAFNRLAAVINRLPIVVGGAYGIRYVSSVSERISSRRRRDLEAAIDAVSELYGRPAIARARAIAHAEELSVECLNEYGDSEGEGDEYARNAHAARIRILAKYAPDHARVAVELEEELEAPAPAGEPEDELEAAARELGISLEPAAFADDLAAAARELGIELDLSEVPVSVQSTPREIPLVAEELTRSAKLHIGAELTEAQAVKLAKIIAGGGAITLDRCAEAGAVVVLAKGHAEDTPREFLLTAAGKLEAPFTFEEADRERAGRTSRVYGSARDEELRSFYEYPSLGQDRDALLREITIRDRRRLAFPPAPVPEIERFAGKPSEARAYVKATAAAIGAEIAESYDHDADAGEIEATAPDGFKWAEDLYSLVATYGDNGYSVARTPKQSAWEDLATRISAGLIVDPGDEDPDPAGRPIACAMVADAAQIALSFEELEEELEAPASAGAGRCSECQRSCVWTREDGSDPQRRCYGWYEIDSRTNRDGSRVVADGDSCERFEIREELPPAPAERAVACAMDAGDRAEISVSPGGARILPSVIASSVSDLDRRGRDNHPVWRPLGRPAYERAIADSDAVYRSASYELLVSGTRGDGEGSVVRFEMGGAPAKIIDVELVPELLEAFGVEHAPTPEEREARRLRAIADEYALPDDERRADEAEVTLRARVVETPCSVCEKPVRWRDAEGRCDRCRAAAHPGPFGVIEYDDEDGRHVYETPDGRHYRYAASAFRHAERLAEELSSSQSVSEPQTTGEPAEAPIARESGSSSQDEPDPAEAREFCPKCGRPAIKVRRYTDGSALYVHAEIPAPFGIPVMEATDACHVPAPPALEDAAEFVIDRIGTLHDELRALLLERFVFVQTDAGYNRAAADAVIDFAICEYVLRLEPPEPAIFAEAREIARRQYETWISGTPAEPAPAPARAAEYESAGETARRLGLDRRTPADWARAGRIPGAYQTQGGHWRIPAGWTPPARR